MAVIPQISPWATAPGMAFNRFNTFIAFLPTTESSLCVDFIVIKLHDKAAGKISHCLFPFILRLLHSHREL